MQKIGQQFIQAYYATLLQQKDELPKFYDQEAAIWRDSFESGESKKVEDCKDILALNVPQGSEVAITSFADNSFPGGSHISVYGHIISNENTKVFNQTFVLVQRSDRTLVVSDALKVSEESAVVDTKSETYQYQTQKQSKAQKQNKFLPYRPKNGN